jgi:hypothetical protein
MLYEYDTHIECIIDKEEEFLLFFNYLKFIILPYERHMCPNFILQKGYTPKSFILLSENDPFFEENHNINNINNTIYEQFYITNDLFYTIKNNHYYIFLNMFLYKRYIDENDIFITWLLHLSRNFNNLHIKNYQSIFDSNFDYYEPILYTNFHNNDFIDIYDISIETYYLKKNGVHVLNEGFYILYPMYKDILHFSNYESYYFYKLLYHFKFSNLIDKPFLLNKKYLHTLIQFNDLLQKHKYIRHLIIDQTIYLIKNYNECGLIKFQSFVKHKLKLRKLFGELNEFNYLPPFTQNEFNELFENKYYKIYGLGGPLFREKKNNFYQK